MSSQFSPSNSHLIAISKPRLPMHSHRCLSIALCVALCASFDVFIICYSFFICSMSRLHRHMDIFLPLSWTAPPVYRNTLDCLRLDIVVTYHHVQTTTLFFLFSPSFLCHCHLLFSGVVFLLKTFICNIVVAPQIPAHSRSFHSSLRTLPPPRTTLGEMDAISILGISTYMDDFLWIFLVEAAYDLFFLEFCIIWISVVYLFFG